MTTNALETYVRKLAVALHEYQICRLYKIPNDIKITGGKIIHADQGPCDFIGFTVTGRAMLVECKMFQKPSLPIGEKGLKPHQYRALVEVHRAGGIGLLVWQNDFTIAVIDPEQITKYSRGRKSLPWKAIPESYKKDLVSDPRRFFWPFLPSSTPVVLPEFHS